MEPKLTAVEVVGLAIRSEEEASKFYGQISKSVKNELVKARYEHLAREEALHKSLLTSLYKSMTGDEVPPPRIPGEPVVAEGAGEAPASASLEDMLKLAIRREQEATRFYRDAAAQASDPTGRSLLEYLADNERSHEAMLLVELEAYLRDKDWYANNPDIQLV